MPPKTMTERSWNWRMSSNYSGLRTLSSVSFPCRVRTPPHTRGAARAPHAVLGLGLHGPAGAPSQTATTAHTPCSGRYDAGAELVGLGLSHIHHVCCAIFGEHQPNSILFVFVFASFCANPLILPFQVTIQNGRPSFACVHAIVGLARESAGLRHLYTHVDMLTGLRICPDDAMTAAGEQWIAASAEDVRVQLDDTIQQLAYQWDAARTSSQGCQLCLARARARPRTQCGRRVARPYAGELSLT